MAQVALGIRPKTGWAIVVAMTGAGELVARRRIEIADGDEERFAWHNAQLQGWAPDVAEANAAAVSARAVELATAAVAEVVAEVRDAGHEAVAAGVIGVPKDLPEAAKVLASHTLLHTAEGELFRAAVADAAEANGLPVTPLDAKAADPGRFAGIRAAHGPPWTADHRLAAAAALAAL